MTVPRKLARKRMTPAPSGENCWAFADGNRREPFAIGHRRQLVGARGVGVGRSLSPPGTISKTAISVASEFRFGHRAGRDLKSGVARSNDSPSSAASKTFSAWTCADRGDCVGRVARATAHRPRPAHHADLGREPDRGKKFFETRGRAPKVERRPLLARADGVAEKSRPTLGDFRPRPRVAREGTRAIGAEKLWANVGRRDPRARRQISGVIATCA